MFRKPFKVKSNNAIRGSDRRKLKDNIRSVFPRLAPDEVSHLVPNKEVMSIMTISTHNDKTVTCYFLQKNPIFFDVDGTLLPTVYTLWIYPQMILSFTTPAHVFPILAGGADLLFPGVVFPSSGVPDFPSGAPTYVSLLGNGAAVAVGVSACSSEELKREGCKGKRVLIYHCYKDFLWNIGEKDTPPLLPDFTSSPLWKEIVESSDGSEEVMDGLNIDVNNLELTEEITEEAEVMQAESDVENGEEEKDLERNGKCDTLQKTSNGVQIEGNDINGTINLKIESEGEDELQLSPQEEMDSLLRNCFYQALLDAKKIELPILVSKFSSQYLHGACPEGQRIDVKKSSYKKMSVFLSAMQNDGLVIVKELSKGVESITKMDIQNEIMMAYSQSKFAKERKNSRLEKMEEEKEIQKQQSKTIEIRELFAVSAKAAPFFKLYEKNKGTVVSSSEVRQILTAYVKDKELIDKSKKNVINLDALLTDVLYAKGQHQHTVNWDGIMNLMLKNMNPCHEVVCPGQEPVIRKGKMAYVEVNIENRMGNKKVTVIKNLECYGIDTKLFAQSLQHAAASSTSVNPVPGKDNTGTFVIVQGVQMKHVKSILEAYKIPLKFVKGLQTKK